MAPSSLRLLRVLAVVALLTVPLLCAELFFRSQDPGPMGGVYLETDRAYSTTLLETDRALHTLEGYITGAPGSSREAITKSPAQVGGRKLAFFIVAPRNSRMLKSATSATLWAFVADGRNDRFRDDAVAVPATITQINPEVYRVSSEELNNVWSAGRVAFRQYQQALFHTTVARQGLEVMIGLELQDSDTNGPRMYSVRVGPPR